MPSQELIDQVLEQIAKDVAQGDFSSIEELIKFIPERNLKAYLPEETHG